MDKRYEKPSSCTLIYWLVQDKKIDPGIFFNFLEFFWPTFVQKDNYVFIKEKFFEEEFNRLIKEKSNPEYWINLLTVDDFFSEIDDGDERSIALAKVLVEIWREKLKRDFPSLNFIIDYIYDEEQGDFGLTFYQNNKGDTGDIMDSNGVIHRPNIKENKLQQSSIGPRPGYPEIKKPSCDEIPGS